MNLNDHLIIFIKNPELGKVKTRLASGIGDEKALEVYNQLLKITHDQTQPVSCIKHVCYSDHVDDSDNWDKTDYHKHVQSNGGLGERMLGAFQGVFDRGAEKMVIIGSDCPEITTDILNEAFLMLDKYDVVIGPAKDGGYYLLGMKCPLPMLFKNKEWSTDSVFADTILDLIDMGLSHYRLKELSDLDTIYDLPLLE
ncbi:MAG: rSAM/selenodomain-associated transferase 1 [Granulosicoccus sp.]|jgi:rSAM/selenodomain-associated transferase 1